MQIAKRLFILALLERRKFMPMMLVVSLLAEKLGWLLVWLWLVSPLD
jgi:hypothetical protein